MAKLENIKRGDLGRFSNLLYEVDSSGWHKELWGFEVDGVPTWRFLDDAWDAIEDDDLEGLNRAMDKINEHWDRYDEQKES